MKILVAGATGTVGHHLVEQLHQAGHSVRALTRNPAKTNFPAGVEVVVGDLSNPASLESALEGVTGLHLITFGGDNYVPLTTGPEIVALAQKAGIKRVTVLTGGMNSPLEQAVKASSLAWTMLNPVEFMSNILEWGKSIREANEIRLPFGDRKTAIVHEADIASVGATALTEDGHAGKTYPISGPEVLTPRIMTQTIGAALGNPVNFIELTPDEARKLWIEQGRPEQLVNFLLWAYEQTPPVGYNLVQTVKEVTGKPGRTFAQWVNEHIEAFHPVVSASE